MYTEMQKNKDSQGHVEEDLDHRSQHTYKMIGIEICGLVSRSRGAEQESGKQSCRSVIGWKETRGGSGWAALWFLVLGIFISWKFFDLHTFL